MQIESKTYYCIDGKQFDSLEKCRVYVESEIGKIIDQTANRLPAKDALAVFNALVANRDRLAYLLTLTAKEEGWSGHKNILTV